VACHDDYDDDDGGGGDDDDDDDEKGKEKYTYTQHVEHTSLFFLTTSAECMLGCLRIIFMTQ
jgi:hypothetical protein